MATAAGRAATACHALLIVRALRARAPLRLRNHCCYFASGSGGGSSSPSSSRASWLPVLAALLVAALLFVPGAVAFFLPLVASTSAFVLATAAYLSAATDPGRGAAREVVLVRGAGGPAEAGTLQVYADADASAYGGGGVQQVGCFLRRSAKRGFDEDGEEVVFAGRLMVPAPPDAGAGALEEELVSLQVDRLAEGVWNSYFGRWSTWNHYAVDGCDD